VLSPLASALRLASFVLCLIVVASFALFAINQTSNASAHQQQELNEAAPTTATGSTPDSAAPRTHSSKSSARKVIDEASEAITSPFSVAADATSDQWLKRAINLLLALLVYGFGLGFLARVIRVRV
jgi:hypothetical protein